MTAPALGISVENDAGFPVDADQLRQAARTVISQHAVDPTSEMTIFIADDDIVQSLNLSFRRVKSVTDVLSFPAEPLPAELLAEMNEHPYLGDLIIAYPYATAQAESLGHAVPDSLALLVVHGTLHLLCYDHDTPENRAAMWAAQETALLALGISPDLVPGLEDAPHDS